MLRKTNDLIGNSIKATDGEIGRVTTLYFDDDRWTVRYFVVDTGEWLPGRKVLVSPVSVLQASRAGRSLSTALTREQVKSSPSVDTQQPISRQQEIAHADYYQYPYYWVGPGVWGAWSMPSPVLARADSVRAQIDATEAERAQRERNSRLRDVREVTGYHIQAADGSIGHVEDFLVEDDTWSIRYLVVDTSNWIGGRRVLIAPRWVSRISWAAAKLHLAMSRDAIRSSPEYDPSVQFERTDEERLYAHYAQPPYWRDAEVGEGESGESDRDRLARTE